MVELFALLLIFMIIGAMVALESRNLLASVISMGVVGFGVSVAFLFLGAPDIAITQVVVEVLTLVILIRVTVHRDLSDSAGSGDLFGVLAGVSLLMVVFVFGLEALRVFPEFGNPIINALSDAPANHYLREGLKDTGAANMVTAVILDYRAYDTLGEATVIFTAILGALAILRSKARKGKDARESEE